MRIVREAVAPVLAFLFAGTFVVTIAAGPVVAAESLEMRTR